MRASPVLVCVLLAPGCIGRRKGTRKVNIQADLEQRCLILRRFVVIGGVVSHHAFSMFMSSNGVQGAVRKAGRADHSSPPSPPCGGRRDFSFNAIPTQNLAAPMDATKDRSQHLVLACSPDSAMYFLEKII